MSKKITEIWDKKNVPRALATLVFVCRKGGEQTKITPAAQEQTMPKITIYNLIKYLLVNKCTAIMDPILIKRKMIHDKKRKEKIMPRE